MDSSNSLFVVRANQDLKSNGIERKVSDKIDLIKMNKASIPKTKDLELLHLSDIEEDEVEKKFDSYNCYNKTNANSRILLSSIASNSDAITTSQAIQLKMLVLGSPLTLYCDEWRNQYFEFNSNKSLYYGLVQRKNPQSIGCVSLLYSCLLTRDCDRVRQDFDDPNTTLIGRHNYCTQEMVNLFLMGRAVSNVFNNDIKCDSLTLHGVCKPSQIGFLSLYEFYKSFEVGSNYKNPQYPIYVILSESHFSVLFSKHRIETRQQFEMNYYDGLGLQEEEIRLTIRTQTNSANGLKAHSDDGQPLVPLECVIRTKWPNAMIDWNGATKLL